MPDDDGAIRIPARELYDTLRRLETKVDLLQAQNGALNTLIQAQSTAQTAVVNDHEARIRSVESRFTGVAVAAMTIVLTGVAAVIWKVATG